MIKIFINNCNIYINTQWRNNAITQKIKNKCLNYFIIITNKITACDLDVYAPIIEWYFVSFFYHDLLIIYYSFENRIM